MEHSIRFRIIQFSRLSTYLQNNPQHFYYINKLNSFNYLQETDQLQNHNLSVEDGNIINAPEYFNIMEYIKSSTSVSNLYPFESYLLIGYIDTLIVCSLIIERISDTYYFNFTNKNILPEINNKYKFLILGLGVHPQFRGLKLCQTMIKIIIKYINANYSNVKLYLVVDKTNIPANKCYDNLDFKQDLFFEVKDDPVKFSVLSQII